MNGLVSGMMMAVGVTVAAAPPVFHVGDFGAILTDERPDDGAWSKCLRAAIDNGGVCRIGPGKLMLTRYPEELRQNGAIAANRDLNGLVIEGAGQGRTVIHGTSAKGFDVFQLNAVANVTLRDFTITAEKTSDDDTQGVNGVSLTNGTARVTIERVTVRKLPYVVKPGRFDGGKAFTVQQGIHGAASSTEIEIRNCTVEDSPIGFGLDADPNQPALPGKMRVRDNRIERVALGFALSFSEKTSGGVDVLGFGIEISGNKLVDVTRVLFIGRAPDVVFSDNTIETRQLPMLPDPIVHSAVPLVILGGSRVRIEDNVVAYRPKIPAMALIGGASMNAGTERLLMSGNTFTGPADLGLKALNAGIRNSRFIGNRFSGGEFRHDKAFADPDLKNVWQEDAADSPLDQVLPR